MDSSWDCWTRQIIPQYLLVYSKKSMKCGQENSMRRERQTLVCPTEWRDTPYTVREGTTYTMIVGETTRWGSLNGGSWGVSFLRELEGKPPCFKEGNEVYMLGRSQKRGYLQMYVYNRTSDKGHSEKRTASLERTVYNIPKRIISHSIFRPPRRGQPLYIVDKRAGPLFRGSTIIWFSTNIGTT